VFGIDQQLRGAHFLSHDLFTAMICWAVALGLSRWMLRPRDAGRPA
jgi:membrane-associated PAP2 superfamily phosphatase